MQELMGQTGQGAGDPEPPSPLDRRTVQELMLKISEGMNRSLLSLVGDEGDFDGIGALLCPRSPVEGSLENGSSRNRQVLPENGPISKAADNLERIIAEASKAYGVDRDLIRSVVKVESGFEVRSTSPKGARGLMQLMPDTARELGVRNSFDPVENIMGGTRYLRKLLDRYHGDVRLALASYNWGMGNVERNPDRLPAETTHYISRVLKHYGEAKA